MKTMKRQAFTLIELLVVIAVIAIIAAILFPVFAKVREKARQTTCVSNERQIGMALEQYTEDNDECLPIRTPNGEPYTWKFEIYGYLKSTEVYKCPSNPYNGTEDHRPNIVPGVPDFMVSYAANRGAGYDSPILDLGFDPSPPVNLSMIESPSQVISIVETTSNYTDFILLNPSKWGAPNDSTDPSQGHLFAGHTGHSNFLFLDCHVKAMKPLATLDVADGGSGDTNMWTNDNKPFIQFVPATATTGNAALAYAQKFYE